MQTISGLGFKLLKHIPFSPHLATTNYHVFPQIKKVVKVVNKFNDEVSESHLALLLTF